MKPESLKSRLAWLVGGLALLQGLVVLWLSYATFERELGAQRRQLLLDSAQQARLLIEDLSDAEAIRNNAYRLVEIMTGRGELHVAVASAGRRESYVASSPTASASLDNLWNETWQADGFLEWFLPLQATPMLSVAAAVQTRDSQPYEIVVSIDRSEDAKLLHRLRLTAITATPFVVAALFGAVMLIVSLGLRPLARFQQAVDSVTVRSLSNRVETSSLPEELARLGMAFNRMLGRLVMK